MANRQLLLDELVGECRDFVAHAESFAGEPDNQCGPECVQLLALVMALEKFRRSR